MSMSEGSTCYRCKGIADDPALIRNECLSSLRRAYTMTLCRACFSYCAALITKHPEGPQAALKMYRITPYFPNYEDIVQELNVTYWRCAVKYNPEHNIEFSSYALDSLRQAVKTCLSQNNSYGFNGLFRKVRDEGRCVARPRSLERLNRDREVCGELGAVIYDIEGDLECAEQSEIVREAVGKLTRRERFVIRSRYLSDPKLTLQEIGDLLRPRVSIEGVRQIEVRTLKKLRILLQGLEIMS